MLQYNYNLISKAFFVLPHLAVWLGLKQALFIVPFPFWVFYVPASKKALFQSLFSICPFPFSYCVLCPLLPHHRSKKTIPYGSHVRRHYFSVPVHKHSGRSRRPHVLYVPAHKGKSIFNPASKSGFQWRSGFFILGFINPGLGCRGI